MTDLTPTAFYNAQLQKHNTFLKQLQKKRSFFGWARLVLVVATGVFAYFAFNTSLSVGLIVLASGGVLFLILLHTDTSNNTAIANTSQLIAINEEELKILDHQFQHRFNGGSFAPQLHPYAEDLDLFGPASLFQYINRCSTEQGRTLFAANMLHPLPVDAIKEWQESAKELAGLHQWRHQFQAFAAQASLTLRMQQRMEDWLNNEEAPFTKPYWSWFVHLYSAGTIASAVAATLGYLPPAIFSFLFLLYFLYAGAQSKKVIQLHANLSRIVAQTDGLQKLISSLEQQMFVSLLLKKHQTKIGLSSQKASDEIKKLKVILGRFDLRLNMFLFFIINPFLLWDVRQAKALNKWKEKNRTSVPHWFSAIAEAEVLISLGTLHFNQPQWVFAGFSTDYCLLKGQGIGHPLLPAAERVTSDFDIEGQGKIALITGSNMAGKSTFLRSLGVNLLLAQMGAPVCAEAFLISPMKLMSSMRIADDLSENTSTFYAELKKLKSIIDEVRQHGPLLILLDEILRGTNSLDRHAGSKALMKQLIREETVAVLATHDVALAQLSEQFPEAIENYHFDVQVANEDDLYFDYKLKKGVCKSLNAAILMRKIGIEM